MTAADRRSHLPWRPPGSPCEALALVVRSGGSRSVPVPVTVPASRRMTMGETRPVARPPVTIWLAIALPIVATFVGIVLDDRHLGLGVLIFAGAAVVVIVRRSLAGWSVMVIMAVFSVYLLVRDGVDDIDIVGLVVISLTLAALCAPPSRRWANL